MPRKRPQPGRTPSYAGLRIRVYRQHKGLTQAELAALTGTDKGQIARYETGDIQEPRRDTLDRISTALGRPIEDFILGTQRSLAENAPNDWEAQMWQSDLPLEFKKALSTFVRLAQPYLNSHRKQRKRA